jgi:hypothetical protein
MDPDSLRPSAPRRRIAPYLWMGAAAAALVGMLVQAWQGGPFDAAGRERMANDPGDLRTFLVRGAVELLVLALVLRVWSYRHAPGRAALALALCLPWAVLSSAVCMHCGPIGGAHAVWLLLVAAGLFVALVVSAVATVRSRRTPSPAEPIA